MKQLVKLIIPNYPEDVILSNSRRKKYYKSSMNKKYIPKKYLTDEYIFEKGFLVDKLTKEKVIANPKVAGTPKTMTINGQKAYQGMNVHSRAKLVRELKEWFMEKLKDIPPLKSEDYPVGIQMNFYKPIVENANYDLDNMSYFYRKCGNDAIVKNGILIDDSVEYLRSNPCTITHSEERYLEILIFKI